MFVWLVKQHRVVGDTHQKNIIRIKNKLLLGSNTNYYRDQKKIILGEGRKERNGKERNGTERNRWEGKGREGKGKDRTGQDRRGEERRGKERKGRKLKAVFQDTGHLLKKALQLYLLDLTYIRSQQACCAL